METSSQMMRDLYVYYMREIELRNVKGCPDYAPREQYIRNYISDTLKKVFEKSKIVFEKFQTRFLFYN